MLCFVSFADFLPHSLTLSWMFRRPMKRIVTLGKLVDSSGTNIWVNVRVQPNEICVWPSQYYNILKQKYYYYVSKITSHLLP